MPGLAASVPPLATGDSLVAVARIDDLAAAPGFGFPLPPEDEARISRLVKERDRHARRAAWRLARACLGVALGLPPEAVGVSRDRRGRPHLTPCADVDFNVSHSGSIVAVGLLRGGRIGIDVEHQRPLETWGNLVGSFLGTDDVAAWIRLDADTRADTALSAWCRKEAVLKATGEGLAGDPRALSLPLEARAVTIARSGGRFRVARLPAPGLAPDACLAVAVESEQPPRVLGLSAGGWVLSAP